MRNKIDTPVDIVMPTFNSMRWLPKTIESILSQTHQNWKLYITDDGSSDDTKKYILGLKEKRIHYISQQHKGAAAARNSGITQGSSPFIAFIDADDIWYPTKLADQLQLMQQDTTVGLVYGQHYNINDQDIITSSLKIDKRGDLFEELCHGNCIAGSASMAMISRSIVDKVGVFREDLVNGEDWEYWLRISQHCKIDYVPKIIAAIRQHGDSVQSNTKRMADGLVQAFEVITSEYTLTRSQRIYIASYCLFNAAKDYFASTHYLLARKTIIRLLKENPHALFELDNWTVKFGVGPYYKILFSNPFTDLLGKLLRLIQKALSRLLDFGFRVVRKLTKIVRRV
ncbi:MAG: glycosyltransferase [Candidatus Saccharibacteria bacterium]|nr:glycosyltransferase [Candidatus Saccharibacteria bacterium]